MTVDINSLPNLEVTGNRNSNGVIFTQDAQQYRHVTVQFTGTFTADVIFEGSNDNSNWHEVGLTPLLGSSGQNLATSASGAGATNLVFTGGLQTRYLRFRVTGYASGTVNVTGEFSAVSPLIPVQIVRVEDQVTVVQNEVPLPTSLWAADGTAPTHDFMDDEDGIGLGNRLIHVGANLILYDETATTHDRWRGSMVNGAYVDVRRTPKSGTATLTNVNDSATSVSLLVANADRLGATIWNDSTVALYVKLGATAALTDCTAKVAADGYYEVPFGYTGAIDGIWASNASGAARITELES